MPSGWHSAKFEFFLKKILCRVPSGRHSAKFEFFLKKILCRVPWSWHSAKLEKWFSKRPFFQLCRVLWPWHLATGSFAECNTRQSDPKRQFLFYFYIPSWQINSYKHISHIYLIHHIYISFITYISHPSHIYLIHPHIHPHISHPSQYISHI